MLLAKPEQSVISRRPSVRMPTWCGLAFVCALGCAGRTGVETPEGAGGAAGAGGVFGAMGGASPSGGADAVGGDFSSGGSGVGGAQTGGSGAGGEPSTFEVGDLIDFLRNPDFPDSFWRASSFDEASMDEDKIAAALAYIAQSKWEIHSLLIARHGRLVVERYGWNQGTNPIVPGTPHLTLPSEPQPLWSGTKSVLSALFGIALDEKWISSVNAPVKDFFPDFADLNPSPEKEAITLADLLTMRSGLDLTEPEPILEEAPDAARAALLRDMVGTPGERWVYSSGNSAILAEVLRVATGLSPLEFANERLFAPLEIDSPSWLAGRSGTQHGGFGLTLTAREMARFGELYRNDGTFNDLSVVSRSWVQASTAPYCAADWGGQYGYHFWIPSPELPGFFNTLGAFGQFIYVSQELGLVIVVTAERPNETAKNEIQELIASYIVPAVR